MSSRSAIDTIKGYLYQFDRSIEQLLELSEDTDSIAVEQIEDIDVNTANEVTAIQCKYYSKTEYNHSVIARPIRLMLTHYKELKCNNTPFVKYMIYGKYKSGQNKLVLPLNKNYLIDHFLTYSKDKITRYHHKELALCDGDIENFLSFLTININAKDYNEQYQSILYLLKRQFCCSDFEAEHYYYNNALSLIKNLAVKKNRREITRGSFLKEIDKKQILFNAWFLKLKGKKKYCKALKNEYFKSSLNTSPFERIFLIEIQKNNDSLIANLKMLIMRLQKKWSKISKRDKQSFCPYIYIHGIDDDELINLKAILRDEGYCCIDGYDFYNATFCAKSITKQATYDNDVKLKFINRLDQIESTLKEIKKTIEIYQFYIDSPYYQLNDSNIKHVKIQVANFIDIGEIAV